jgi:hypothetical protein
MTKHKAPWRVETNSMGRVVTVCSADGWPIARMVEDTDKDGAALIAAAPELLEFARWVLSFKMRGLIDSRANAVIAKATGGSHG